MKIQEFFLLDGVLSKQKTLLLLLLFAWTTSIIFKNAVYQASFTLLNLLFFWHVFYYKNIQILKEIFKQTRFLTICFALLFAFICLSNFINYSLLDKKSWENTILIVFRFATIFIALCYFYRLNFFEKRDILIFLFIGIFLLMLSGVLEIYKDLDTVLLSGYGIKGFLSNRNGFGLFMGFGFVLSLMFIKNHILKFVFINIFLFFMIFSFSRSSWVASFCTVIAFFVLNLKEFKRIYLLYTFISIAFLMAIYLSFDAFESRFTQLMQGDGSGRILIWKYSVDMIAQSPFFGYGMSTFKNLANSPFLTRSDFNSTHNMVLEILLYTGFIGLVFYMSMVAKVFAVGLKDKNYAPLLVLFYFLVVCQFDYGAYSKEILSIVSIFVFFIYSDRIRS